MGKKPSENVEQTKDMIITDLLSQETNEYSENIPRKIFYTNPLKQTARRNMKRGVTK